MTRLQILQFRCSHFPSSLENQFVKSTRQKEAVLCQSIETWPDEGARSAIPAEHVARLVEECFIRPRPKIRTTVGRDAAIAAILRWLFGERLFYRMIARTIKIP